MNPKLNVTKLKILRSKPLLVLFALGVFGWFAVAQYQNAHTVTFTIPPGTGQQLAAGNQVVDFPSELVFTVGDTIIIENQDNVVHAFGPFTILPQTKLTKRFKTARVYQNSCTFHQDRQMTLIVNPAPWDIFQ